MRRAASCSWSGVCAAYPSTNPGTPGRCRCQDSGWTSTPARRIASRQVRVAGLSSQPGERDEQVKPGRDALDAALGQVRAQRPQQGITPAPLALADQPDVLLEFAARDEPGQH